MFTKLEIKKDGKMGEAIIMKGLGYGFDEEAKRLLNNMPNWIPGEDQYIPVNTFVFIPIKFEPKN